MIDGNTMNSENKYNLPVKTKEEEVQLFTRGVK